ncbi:hypothetical protein P8452_18288 [Trifolium repens]|nr:hypothetical protein P8452_18288 [Trifolium repens]
MDSSCNSGSGSRDNYLRYANKICSCKLLSDIKVSLSYQNRLYYSCNEKKCKWLGWCEPIADDADGKKIAESNDTGGGARMNTLEVEVNNLKDLVDRMSEGLREEFATIKFEFDNAISDGKKDVDKRLTVLKDDFDKEVLTLKAELRAMKQRNGNLKLAMFGFILVIVLVFINKHI